MENIKNMENKENQTPTAQKRVLKIFAIVLAFIVTFTAGYFSKYIFDNKKANLVSEVVKTIEKQGYVVDFKGVPKDISEEEYADTLVKEFLDAYSEYYTKQEYEEIMSQKNGDMSGFGVTVANSSDATPTILSVVMNSPADLAVKRISKRTL